MSKTANSLVRIAVCYDGNFFSHVSNYYKYAHDVSSRISISGLHEFIRHSVAVAEGLPSTNFCPIVQSHFFRGRFSAKVADERQCLYNDRVFDDILMWEGVQVHYMPIKGNEERGVDVTLALETYELAASGKVDIIVLIAGDRDYLSLVRKVLGLGVKVMILGWDFEYRDEMGRTRQTFTSDGLLSEATYPVEMQTVIGAEGSFENPVLEKLFVRETTTPPTEGEVEERCVVEEEEDPNEERFQGEVCTLGKGFGFIRSDDYTDNVFFYWEEVRGTDFANLRMGDKVTFAEGKNDRGIVAVRVKLIVSE